MRISPRALGASLFSLMAGGLMVAACSDQSGPFLPPPPIQPPYEALAELRCTGSVPLQTVRCERADGSGSQSLLIVGGQHTNVSLYSNNIAVADFGADSVDFSFDVVVENLIRQPMGTQDTAAFAPDPSGVRVFFHTGPTATGGNGDIRVFNPTAVGTFTGSNQPYFEYDQVSRGGVVGPMPLFRNDSTTALNWILRMPDTVTDFAFTLYVSTQVPYQNGWTDVSPDSSVAAWRRFREDTVVVPVGAQVQLQGAVRDRVGRLEMTVPTYASSNDAVATVDAAGQVDALVLGSALISGMAAGRPSQRRTRVIVNNPSNLFPDSASALVNVTRSVAAPGVLANDNDPEDPLSVIPGPVTTAEGGTAVLNADGSFTYVSDAGETMARDSFMYHATDGAQEDSAWVVMKLENQGLWYVQADAAAGGTGTDQAPFQTIGGAQASAAATDSILVRASATELDEAVTLEAGQTLIGAGIEFDMTYTLADGAVQTVLSAGVAPVLAPQTAGDAVALSTNNTIRGLAITAADGAGIRGSDFGTLTTTRLALNPRGPALDLATGTLNASIDILSSDSSATVGLELENLAGSLTAMRGLILDPVSEAVVIVGGTATLSLGDSIRSTRGSGIVVVNRTGGTVTFSAAEKTLVTGASSAISLSGNTGSGIVFSGGGLAITTTTGSGLVAAGGGTLQVTGANNTVSSGTGTAVSLSGIESGAGGVTFRSISANGAPSGIVLASVTGNGFQVTGDGATGGSGGTLQNTTGHAVSLSDVVTTNLAFLTVTGAGAGGSSAVFGSSFGTLTVQGVSASASGGPALSLATGTLNGTFSTLSSANSATNGIALTTVDGSFGATGGSVTNPAGAAVAVSGGNVTASYAGSLTQPNGAPLVSVSGGHATGTLTFSTGTLSATGGTGLQFNDADGIYVFSGTTTLNGGDAGIDITNGSGGTFTFGTGTTVTGPSGSAFAVNGSSPTVTYSGNLTKANAGLLVEIGEQPGGTITFQTGTLSATLGTGISLSNADGTVNFNGTTTLNGGDAGVDVVAGSGGTFGFGSGTAISNPTGNGLHIVDSAPTALNYAGTITTGPASGRPVFVDGPVGACGIVNVSGGVTSTGQGILVQDCTGGTVTFSGSKSLSTGANQAVTLTNNTGATIAFTTGGLVITTTTGTGFGASGGGTLSVSGAGNSITSGTGTALSLNGVTVGAGHMAFGNITATGAANAVSLTNVTGTGAINVAASTVAGGAGAAILVTGGSADVNWNGNVTQATAAQPLLSVTGGHNGDLAFLSGTLSATNGTGMQFDNADGTYNFIGTTTLNGGNAGVDVIGGSSGTIAFAAGSSITNPNGEVIRIESSTPSFTYAGSFTKLSGGIGILAQSNTGGTIDISGSGTTKSLSTGASNAVSLVNNGGTMFNFTNGGLVLATSSGTAFNATGGGMVNVTGGANTVSATNGVGLNIQNTTIGGNGVTFRSVSATGGVNGISLHNTGTSGGLTVAGDAAAGSGGTIQNTSGAGISLNNTSSPTFNRMVVQTTGSHGISGSLVSNFSFTNGTISVSGTSEVAGRQESNISFYQNAGTGTERNVTGNVTITGNTLNTALHHGINITQYDGTISSLSISNNTFTSATASSGSTTGATTSHGSAISINPIGSGATIASVTSATISNNVITGFPGNAGIIFVGGNTNVGGPSGTYGTAGDSITIQSNRIRGHSSANLMNTQAVNIAVGARGTGFFRVLDNGTLAEPITNMAGHAITASALGQATLGLRVTNNRIVANNTVGSQGISMGVDSAAGFATTAVMNSTVNSNSISATHGSGIFALATRRGTMNAKILNNSVAAPSSGTYGIQLLAATSLANTGTGCYSISGNTTAGGVNGGTTFPGIGLRRQSGAATAPNALGIVGLPAGSTATPNVENYVNSLNASASGTFGVGGTALISASSGFSSCTLSF